ncbi:hypothetical protein EUGRSUZ_G00305 [Eucalyptus grandis]|uniref:Uncharacterized protein n=2 Tax=Eucalyptus grandis TaxID=71139 RepID=A0ACC3K169_EUCGR|nr:hypothetical protein EUGRSUZ_G00305 [Eucalyptus grandis]
MWYTLAFSYGHAQTWIRKCTSVNYSMSATPINMVLDISQCQISHPIFLLKICSHSSIMENGHMSISLARRCVFPHMK